MTIEPLSHDIPVDEIIALCVRVGIVFVAIVASHIFYSIFMRMLARLKTTSPFVNYLPPHISKPCKWLFLWCALIIALPFLELPPVWYTRIHHIFYALAILSSGWVMSSITLAASEWLNTRYTWSESEDNLRYRSINTQLRVFTHVIVFVIWMITAIAIIMTIPHLRSIGVSLFASAGVAGIVIGMAAGPTLSNLIAGIQLALTQPIRIGDQIVIENVSGIVEEIDSTYVVVKLWDLRRLIVPLNYFIQNRFQNWTHTTGGSIIGTILLYVDYMTPVEPIREELNRIVQGISAWNKKLCLLQVTEIKDNKMLELKASFSTTGVNQLYPLQCEIREKLLMFIQRSVKNVA